MLHAPAAVNPLLNPLSETSPKGSAPYAVDHLSDDALLAGARSLVARANHQLARLLAHLAEVEARGIHRARACASLCAYCVYELRLSEDTAFRYARAAKLARTFPVLFEHIATGELHLTGLLLLGPHLTEENHRDVLQLAKHRSKREITKLVRHLDPLPDIPARLEPLGPADAGQPRGVLPNPTWSTFMHALNPVRELAPRDRPSHWLRDGQDAEVADPRRSRDTERETRTPTGTQHDSPAAPAGSARAFGGAGAAELAFEPADALDPHTRAGAAPCLGPQRYSVQFTATQEHVDLVERALDLLSHAVPSRSLAEVHLYAMRRLVAELEKRKFGAGSPRSDSGAQEPPTTARALGDDRRSTDRRTNDAATNDAATNDAATNELAIDGYGTELSTPTAFRLAEAEAPRRRGKRELAEAGQGPRRGEREVTGANEAPRRRGEYSGDRAAGGRYIPAHVRHEVHHRDGGRCAYTAADGQRCRETSWLELHHRDPHAHGGAARVDNLALYCRAHNALAAERDFGRSYMARRSGRE